MMEGGGTVLHSHSLWVEHFVPFVLVDHMLLVTHLAQTAPVRYQIVVAWALERTVVRNSAPLPSWLWVLQI